MKLNSYKDIETIQDGYRYISPKKKASYLYTLFFGLLTGDLNPIHINPFTAINFKSKLKGLARHGISTTAQAESFIFKIFQFKEPTEVISKGYDKIRYPTQVNIGDKITYMFTLMSRKVVADKKRADCIWKVTAVNQRNEVVLAAEWIVLYTAVQPKLVRATVYPLGWLLPWSPSMELEDTPTRIFWSRLVTFICLGITIWLFAHFYSNPI